MKIRCAWCGADLGEKEPLEDHRFSHGMCEACSLSYLDGRTRDTLKQYLERLNEPVPKVDEEP
jgi:hypothetical protein